MKAEYRQRDRDGYLSEPEIVQILGFSYGDIKPLRYRVDSDPRFVAVFARADGSISVDEVGCFKLLHTGEGLMPMLPAIPLGGGE